MSIEMPGGEGIADFSINAQNLFREETFTDLAGGAIRRMVPVTADGETDTARAAMYFGSLQIMTPQGPLPVQARLEANNLQEALTDFPGTMSQAVDALVEELEKMKREAESRIVVPGQQ
jgi:hypothetical protein